MRETRTVIKNKSKTITIATVAIVILAFSFCFISSSLNIDVIKTKTLLSYTENSYTDYKVSLKKNNYFDKKELPSNEQYIASVIDKIHMNYKYDFSSSDRVNGTYSYKIFAKVIADYNLDTNTKKKVWSKEYEVKKETTKKIENTTVFNINENISVSYDKYNKIINDFKRDYMLAVNSRVDVIMQVDYDIIYNNKRVKKEVNLTTSVPLSEQTIEIATNYKPSDTGAITEKVIVNRFNNIFVFIFGVLLGIVGAVILIKQFIEIMKDDKKQSLYLKKLKKYLHDYGDIIATSKEPPKTKGLNVIEVLKFEDMVNAQDDLRVPIIFCETKKNQEGKFYLISQDCVYCYILSDDSNKGGTHEEDKTKEQEK